MNTTSVSTQRRRSAPDTASRIREVAEALFAANGIDGVSLRQIAVDAGAGNNNSVQYHFGGKEGLIRSICEARLPRLDTRRAALFGQLSAQEMDDPALLLRVLLRPIAEETDETGAHRWAAFLLAIDNMPGMMAVRVSAEFHAPVTTMVYDRIVRALAPISPAVVRHRLDVAFRNFFRGLAAIDREYTDADDHVRSVLIEDYLMLAAAMLTVPASSELAGALDRE
ncbi:MAG: TetR family transcriptional regulator [Novosphingobium sp.]|nr:TetR family transcriptional regulator [Novosphingobium sp.]